MIFFVEVLIKIFTENYALSLTGKYGVCGALFGNKIVHTEWMDLNPQWNFTHLI